MLPKTRRLCLHTQEILHSLTGPRVFFFLLWKFRKGCLEFRVVLVCAMCTTCTVYILQLEGVVQFPQGGVYATKYTQSVVSSNVVLLTDPWWNSVVSWRWLWHASCLTVTQFMFLVPSKSNFALFCTSTACHTCCSSLKDNRVHQLRVSRVVLL